MSPRELGVMQAFAKKKKNTKCLGKKLKALFIPIQMNRLVSAVFPTDHPGAHKAFGSAVRNQREREGEKEGGEEVEVNGSVTE